MFICFKCVLGECLGVFGGILVVFCMDLGGQHRGKPKGENGLMIFVIFNTQYPSASCASFFPFSRFLLVFARFF